MHGVGREKVEAGGRRKWMPEEDGAQPKQRLGSWTRAACSCRGVRGGGEGRTGEGCIFEGEKVGAGHEVAPA